MVNAKNKKYFTFRKSIHRCCMIISFNLMMSKLINARDDHYNLPSKYNRQSSLIN